MSEDVLLSDVLGLDLLAEMLDAGHVRVAVDPVTGLRVYNYSETAQYGRVWNDVTRVCRGLIVDRDDRVVARPFRKFFNYGEPDAPTLEGPLTVTDKMDGSLGLLYRHDGRLAVATRGSLRSEQAAHATGVLCDRYRHFEPVPSWTYCFEIVYPANRIVVDYEGMDDLVLLGAVDIATGRSVPLPTVAATWPGPVVETLPYTDLSQVLSAPPRDNREGFVVHAPEMADDVRVKIKFPEYVRLHRIVTGLSTVVVWEHLRDGRPLADLLTGVPDELFRYVDEVAASLQAEFDASRRELDVLAASVFESLAPDAPRRELAARVMATGHPLASLVFRIHDGKPVDSVLWDRIRPQFQKLASGW